MNTPEYLQNIVTFWGTIGVFGIGLAIFILMKKLIVSRQDKDTTELQKTFNVLGHKSRIFRVFAIHKKDEKTVRLHIETDDEKVGIIAFSLDLAPTAAMEVSRSLRISAELVGHMELIDGGLK